MAIPDNYIDKFTKDGESRMISPAADQVRVENEHYEGDNLDEVLDEIDEKVSQAGTGNYTKPSTGIPKSDMESAVQTSLGKADSAVQGVQINGGLILPKVHNNVDISVPTKTSQLQNDSGFITEGDLPEGVELDTQMSSTSEKPVQNKVIKAYVDNLINGLIDGAPAALDTLKELATALGNNSDVIANIINTLSSKANASEVVKSISVNGGQAQTPQNGNVNIQSVDGADGVTPHIGSNGNWFIGTTDTEVKARGVDGISVSDPADIEVVHNLDDEKSENFDPTSQVAVMGSDMGKVLKTAISTLIDSMGEYCFPNGRPTLSFEVPKWDVEQNLTNIDTDYSALRVDKNGELTIQLTAQSGYAIDSVVVMMGDVDVTLTYYTAATGIIHIPQVTGDVEITATAVSIIASLGYVKPENLVFMVDGVHQGANANAWTDLINGIVFTPNGATKVANGWQFDGVDDYMAGDANMQSFDPYTHTIEICFNSGLTNTNYYAFVDGGGATMVNYLYNYKNRDFFVFRGTAYTDTHTSQNGSIILNGRDNGNGVKIVSYNGVKRTNNGGRVNGVTKVSENLSNNSVAGKSSIGAMYQSSSDSYRDFFKGTIYAIRVYNTQLTLAEMLANQKVDNERFELGLTLPNS